MWFYYVKWRKVRLLAGQKQRKSIGSEEQMCRHVSGSLNNTGGQKLKKQTHTSQKGIKSVPCGYFNDNTCTFNKHHETKGAFYRHICSSCFTQKGKVSTHSVSDCKKKSVKMINPGHGFQGSVTA